MNGILVELEQQGYKFRLDGEQIMVRGPGLGDQATVELLRGHKPDILCELRLRDFVDLVRAEAACTHGRLLHRDAIRRELDADDVADLTQTTREHRQAWAASIAHRLTAPDPSRQPTLDALREGKR